MKYISAANEDGMLVAIDVDIIGDAGAYVTNSKGLLLGALVVSGGPYNYPYARGRARAILTNNPFTEAMRGVGANQVCFAYESPENNREGINLFGEILHELNLI